MNILDKFIEDVERINWDNPDNAQLEAEQLLKEISNRCTEILEAVIQCLTKGQVLSREISGELISWKLRKTDQFAIAINEFTPWPGPNDRQSVNAHQHKGMISSLCLSGGYRQNYYKPEKPLEEYQHDEPYENLESWEGPSTEPGTVLTMGLDIIHGLTDFDDGTFTLCVFGSIQRHETTTFNLRTGLVRKSYTHKAHMARLQERLQKAANQ